MIKIIVAQKNLVEPTGTWTYHARVIESDTTKMRLIWAQGSFPPTSIPDRNKYAIRYLYAYKAIRTNLIWNLFRQRHSLPRSHTTSLSTYLGQLRPIFEWWIDMALHRYRRFLQRMVTFGKGAVSGWSGWGGHGVRERNTEQQGGWTRLPQLMGHGERDLCHLSVDVRWNCCRMLISSSVCCHRTAKIRDILSSKLLASSFRPMILNANGSGFFPLTMILFN